MDERTRQSRGVCCVHTHMGTIIDLQSARRRRQGTTFAFDLASPWTYLAVDAVAAGFPDARWVPALAPRTTTTDREAVEDVAAANRIRFAWPESGEPEGTAAARAAAYAAEQGRGREFALAACRLAWGWGESLDDHDLIARAAGVAELPLDPVVEATFDPRRDDALRAAAFDGAPALTRAGLVLDGPALAAQTQSSSEWSAWRASSRRGG